MLQDQTATRETSLLQTFREATHWQKQEAKFREAWGFIKSLEDDLSAGHQCNTAFRSLTKLSRRRDGWSTSQGSSSERRLLSPQQWMPLPIMEEWEATPTLEEIGKTINSLTYGKAHGNDGISQDLIKHCKTTILQSLHDTVCQMLEWRWCSTRYERYQDRHPELRSTRRRFNSPTPTRRRIKSSRNVGELVFNPVQLIRS